MATTDGRKYTSMVYESYQMDRPYDPEHVYKSDTASSDPFSRDSLMKVLRELAPHACKYIFNSDNFEQQNDGPYKFCMIFTKHFLCVGMCAYYDKNHEEDTVMYYFDMHVTYDTFMVENVEKKQFRVHQMQAYKINDGKVPDLRFDPGNETVGLRFGKVDPGKYKPGMPIKLPLIGISNKKFVISTRSAFIEGLHVPLYKQPFIFDWHYYKNKDPKPTDTDEIAKAAYAFNQTTENTTESNPPFLLIQFAKKS